MSQSASTTIVNVVNQDIFIGQVNGVGPSLGLSPVIPGTPISQVAQDYTNALMKKLASSFSAVFGMDLPEENQDHGYMGPIGNLQPGVAPPCVVDQVNQDFSNWSLPMTTDIGTRIARTITQHLALQGGVTNFASGTLQVSSNESVLWMAYYGTFSITQDELGAVYAFGAALKS